MADDVTFQDVVLATPPSATVVATDEVGGKHHQKVKVEFGVDGTATQVSAADPLPVSLASAPLGTGAATEAKQDTEIAGLASIDGHVDGVEALLTAIDGGTPAALGQTTMAASMPVVIASNQAAVGVKTTTTPNNTDGTSLVAVTTVALNGVSRTTFSLATKWGAWIYIWLGRGGTTALTNGVDIRIRRTQSNGAFYPTAPLVAFRSQSAAAAATTCAASGNGAGSTSLSVASTTGFAAGDLICIQDAATPTSLTEWAYVSRVTSATVLLLDAPTINAHNNTGHTVRNKADYFTCWIDGGAGATTSHELIIDYGDDTAGEAVTIQASMQTVDSVASA